MIKDVEKLVDYLTQEIKKQVDVAVLGMSGGADSTLCAILCKLALGEQNVYSVHMPYNELDEGKFNSNSKDVAEKLGLNILDAPIKRVADSINEAVVSALFNKFDGPMTIVNKGNGRSRARMTVLYGVAHHLNDQLEGRVRVIGTGNLSEDFIGYDTKGGDALCDIFPIGELFKSEVYQLLEYFRDQGFIDEKNIDRTPSAGLWDGQTDEGELGYTYNEMEGVIKDCLECSFEVIEWTSKQTDPFLKLNTFVATRHLQNKHKHEAPPVIKVRQYCD